MNTLSGFLSGLLFALVLSIGASLFSEQSDSSAVVALPVLAPQPEGAFQGNYVYVQRPGLSAEQPDAYDYSPSEDIRQAAATHHALGRTWYSFVPSGQSPTAAVLLFHGTGRSGLSMLEMWRPVAEEKQIALIALDSKEPNWQPDDLSQTLLDRMLSESNSQRPVDPDRIYLFGHSAGAIYASVLINRFQGPWKAAALHAGFAPANLFKPVENAKPLRIYLGEQEHIFTPDKALGTAKSLAAAGHNVTLQMIPGHTHWFYEIGPSIARDSWAWFASLEQ